MYREMQNMTGLVVFITGLVLGGVAYGYEPVFSKEEIQGETVTVSMDDAIITPLGEIKGIWSEIEKKLGVKIKEAPFPHDMQYEKQMTELAARTGAFDIMTFFPKWKGDFGPYVSPFSEITGLSEEQLERVLGWEDILPVFRGFYMKYKGKIIGGVLDADVHILYYNAKWFDDPEERAKFKAEYGYDLRVPRDWYSDFLDVAEFFTRPEEGKFGWAEWYKRDEGYGWFTMRLFAAGGRLFNEDMTPAINTALGVKAMRNELKAIEFAPPEYLDLGYEKGRECYFDERVAMYVNWTCVGKRGADPKYSHVVGHQGFAQVFNSCPNMQSGRALYIPKDSRRKKAAFEVINYLTAPDVSSKVVPTTGTHCDPWRLSHFTDPSLYKELYESGQAKRYLDVVKRALLTGIPEPDIPGFYRYKDVLDMYRAKVVAKQTTPQKALEKCAEEWETITEELGRENQIEAYKDWLLRMDESGILPDWYYPIHVGEEKVIY